MNLSLAQAKRCGIGTDRPCAYCLLGGEAATSDEPYECARENSTLRDAIDLHAERPATRGIVGKLRRPRAPFPQCQTEA